MKRRRRETLRRLRAAYRVARGRTAFHTVQITRGGETTTFVDCIDTRDLHA